MRRAVFSIFIIISVAALVFAYNNEWNIDNMVNSLTFTTSANNNEPPPAKNPSSNIDKTMDTVYPEEKNRPGISFIDISSHNGIVTYEQFAQMRDQYGVQGVIIKATEGDVYINPIFWQQLMNAKRAGIAISFYHYAHYSNTKAAIEEATFFAKTVKSFGLPKDLVMVADVEGENTKKGDADITKNTIAFINQLRRLGYNNTAVYSMASWIDSMFPKLDADEITKVAKIWIAAYPYHPNRFDFQYKNFSAWQWTSQLFFPNQPIPDMPFDASVAYDDFFTAVRY